MSNDTRVARLNKLIELVDTGSSFFNGLGEEEYNYLNRLISTYVPLEDAEEIGFDLDLMAHQVAYVEAFDRVIQSLSGLILECVWVSGTVVFTPSMALMLVELLARCRDIHTSIAFDHIKLAVDDAHGEIVLSHASNCYDFPWERFQLDPMIAEEHAELAKAYPELKGRKIIASPDPVRLIDRFCELFALENLAQIIEALWFEGIKEPVRSYVHAAIRIMQIRLAADTKDIFQEIADARAKQDQDDAN